MSGSQGAEPEPAGAEGARPSTAGPVDVQPVGTSSRLGSTPEPLLTAADVETLVRELAAQASSSEASQAVVEAISHAVVDFQAQWLDILSWAGLGPRGELARRAAWRALRAALDALPEAALHTAEQQSSALAELAGMARAQVPRTRRSLRGLLQSRWNHVALPEDLRDQPPSCLDRPVFILSAPRSGSTLLVETLSLLPGVWNLGAESHELEDAIPLLHPAARAFHSNRLTRAEATAEVGLELTRWFLLRMQDGARRPLRELPPERRAPPLRFLEKTPKNALRIPFLHALFPDARFIFLYRSPLPCLASMIEGWRSRQFVAYSALPGWLGEEWSFLLIPGWQALERASLAEIVAAQWRCANTSILEDLKVIPREQWLTLDYARLVKAPRETLQRVAAFCGLEWGEAAEQRTSGPLPRSRQVLSAPSDAKWLREEAALRPLEASLMPVLEAIRGLDQASWG